ncbi:hypothetical protein GPL15_05605 [Clostridium sp. MCC353]|uniref:hypothetical protein n=1 Tax=Clostridium sp. MCC353 TaxID=2592646 RepID=UPI001C022776|nr:hypothetical protein [Clostridium sp. MCC353]MBT9775978.1 hypothetical protein [Clostridium sp. MCC353]
MQKLDGKWKKIKKFGPKAAACAVAICLAAGSVPFTADAEEIGSQIENSNEIILENNSAETGGNKTEVGTEEGTVEETETEAGAETEEGTEAETEEGTVEETETEAGAETEDGTEAETEEGTVEETETETGAETEEETETGTEEETETGTEEETEAETEKETETEIEEETTEETEEGTEAETEEESKAETEEETEKETETGLEEDTEAETEGKIEEEIKEGDEKPLLENDLPKELNQAAAINATPLQVNSALLRAVEQDTVIEPLVASDDDGSMKFQLNGFGYDIRGYSGNDELRSALGGYGVYLSINDRITDLMFNDNMNATKDNLSITMRAGIVKIDDISYVRLVYYVENKTEDEEITFSLGSTADTCVGFDDKAIVSKTDNGVLMLGREDTWLKDPSAYIYAFVVTDDDESDACVDRWWYGLYYDRGENLFEGDLPTEDLKDTDSGIAYSWLDKTLEGGQTGTYSVLFGIGNTEDYAEVKPEPEPVPEPVPEPEPEPNQPVDKTEYESEDSEDYDDTEYWAMENGKWTFTNGVSYRNQWGYLYYNGTYGWYFFNQDGYMETGWHTEPDGRKFYLNPSEDGKQGQMFTGWNLIDGKWYYFSQEHGSGKGQLLVSTTTPDGYTVNENGEWVQ